MGMKITLFHSKKDIKAKAALQELRRAHAIIALLASTLAFLIIITSLYPIQLDTILAGIAAALLIVVAAVSISIIFAIPAKK